MRSEPKTFADGDVALVRVLQMSEPLRDVSRAPPTLRPWSKPRLLFSVMPCLQRNKRLWPDSSGGSVERDAKLVNEAKRRSEDAGDSIETFDND